MSLLGDDALETFSIGNRTGRFASLPRLERLGLGAISRLPVSLRIVLESVLRCADGRHITEAEVAALASWRPNAERTAEVPFTVARVLLQDFTGVPLLVDLAALRSAVARRGKLPRNVEPTVPVDLVIDHSVQVDFAGAADAFDRNLAMEFHRNGERYRFLKWGVQAFDRLRIVPPGFGICHQVNLEFLARGVCERGGVYFPDTLVGTDSHTTMVNGLGVVGWGVGGIEAETAMLGQPVYFLVPDVVGVCLTGRLGEGATATDLVLRVTEVLRKVGVVGKFVEFHGEGAASLTVPDRATVANMAPEYGATMGYFPVDDQSLAYLAATGRDASQIELVRAYYSAQGLFGMPKHGECDYSQVVEIDLAGVSASVAGPKRPQDRIEIGELKRRFEELLVRTDATGYGRAAAEIGATYPVAGNGGRAVELCGGGRQEADAAPDGATRDTSTLTEFEMVDNRPSPDRVAETLPKKSPLDGTRLGHGSVVIAAITSCTNTSNPHVMVAAGLLARRAVERGLEVPRWVKTSLAPGSRVVTEYLDRLALTPFLDRLGFQRVGYGCTTCIGNSGPLEPHIDALIAEHDLVVASVLSGNRNFEARVHQSVKANFLMSPPLVVAFALAGRIDIDLGREPVGHGKGGKPVFLRELWPEPKELADALASAGSPETYRRLYSDLGGGSAWEAIPAKTGIDYAWDTVSTYVREPPWFSATLAGGAAADLLGARALAIFGDSVTTDHISPAGAIKPTSPAGAWLREAGVAPGDFNSYGARRGNHEVMVRGTFANVRIRNLMVPGSEGGITAHQPDGQTFSIFDAAAKYAESATPLIVFAGRDYGAGSSRDWAAKGTRLLGVRAVLAESFERIHRTNLVGMGVLPCQFAEGTTARTLKLDGKETFDLIGLAGGVRPRLPLTLIIHRQDGATQSAPVTLRIDTPIEVDYHRHGGLLPWVLDRLVAE